MKRSEDNPDGMPSWGEISKGIMKEENL